MSSTILQTVQDYEFSVRLVTADSKSWELKQIITELNLYADIYGLFQTCDLTINDSNSLLSKLQLTGHEYLIVELDKPTKNQPFKKSYRMYSMGERIKMSDTQELVKLYGCDENMILNQQYKVSRSFKDMKVNQMVKVICDDFKITNINIQETYGIYNLIIPNINPFQAIMWLSTYALDNEAGESGAPFLIFQDSDTFNFCSITRLMKGPVYDTFNYGVKNLISEDDSRVQDNNRDMKNIVKYQQVNNFDVLKKIKEGTFTNKVLAIDPIRRKYTETIFNYAEMFKNSNSLNGSPLITNAVNRFGDTLIDTADSVIKYVFTNAGLNNNLYVKDKNLSLKENNIEIRSAYRTAQFTLLNSNKLKIQLHGDPNIQVGMIIVVNLQEVAFEDGRKSLDEFNSGKYLVTAVRHNIMPTKYWTIVECCKDSISKPLASYDNNSPDWKIIRGSVTKTS